MNEHQSLLNFALAASLSPLDSPLKFLLVTKDGSWKNDPWPSPDLQTSEKKLKQNSNNLIFRSYFIYLREICLNIFANQRKEASLGQHFFFAIRILLQLPFGD